MRNQRWNEEYIEDQSGKVAIITGGSSGLGLEQASVLAQKGAILVLAVRDMAKGIEAVQEIQQKNMNIKIEAMKLDLADLDSIRAFSREFEDRYDHLDLLINNAGVMMPPFGKTKDGFELQFGVNHLGHFALTGRLMPMLMRTETARVVTVSSLANAWNGANIFFEDLQCETSYDKQLAYAQSKLANILFAYELDKKFKEHKAPILSLCAHPGWSVTNLQQHLNVFMKTIAHFMSQPASMGALPILRAATDKDVKGGEYFGPSGINERKGYPVQVKSSTFTHDTQLAKRLWKTSEELTGVTYCFNWN
ncbi:SDR family NAD(P)-dependent oxidoreductase [Bacillus sp. WMMC1349]|uniref:oxidoreductase n=1 Tax=Bacillus sp. WMMC1349 TaxID=2736254 RepID=UPI0015576D7D|nr:oxidoreductase [Bacillus sp. WMMC1349]NPC94695.1 SDR family NAD(P)-dependent oxidoreductase [Bacillus sp. WMMC1349]